MNQDIKANPHLWNEDLAPTSAAQRTWLWYHFAALWVGMVMCIPAYTLSASLVEGGMSAWQAVATVFLANAIVLVPMLAIGHAGTKYGIPYAVLARASFGTAGAKLGSSLVELSPGPVTGGEFVWSVGTAGSASLSSTRTTSLPPCWLLVIDWITLCCATAAAASPGDEDRAPPGSPPTVWPTTSQIEPRNISERLMRRRK